MALIDSLFWYGLLLVIWKLCKVLRGYYSRRVLGPHGEGDNMTTPLLATGRNTGYKYVSLLKSLISNCRGKPLTHEEKEKQFKEFLNI